jgi:hypothetical protein
MMVLTMLRSYALLITTMLYGAVLGIDLGELPHPRPPRLLDQMRFATEQVPFHSTI